jgi:hypothetical protein
VTVHVFESEFCTRSYVIATGKGNQHIHWLASTACLLFGQDHYPNGRYVPSLLSNSNGGTPHPRMRINEEFSDGDECTVTLKDRSKPQSEDERRWND